MDAFDSHQPHCSATPKVAVVPPWLPWLLRFSGTVCSLAWIAFVMPLGWMHWWHDSLGMGKMPQAAVVEYLARSTSALCGLYGVILLWISWQLERHIGLLRLITYSVGGLAVVGCLVMWNSGIPPWWLIGDAVANLIVATAVWVGTRSRSI